jgi:hypothetical protein
MDADVQGCLAQINRSWKAFEHNGKPMTKEEVKAILIYADKQGYTAVSQITDSEINSVYFISYIQNTEEKIRNLLNAAGFII